MAIDWLDSVADGSNTMSQRKLSVIEKRGNLKKIKVLAEKRGVHLLQLEDDKGDQLDRCFHKTFQNYLLNRRKVYFRQFFKIPTNL